MTKHHSKLFTGIDHSLTLSMRDPLMYDVIQREHFRSSHIIAQRASPSAHKFEGFCSIQFSGYNEYCFVLMLLYWAGTELSSPYHFPNWQTI